MEIKGIYCALCGSELNTLDGDDVVEFKGHHYHFECLNDLPQNTGTHHATTNTTIECVKPSNKPIQGEHYSEEEIRNRLKEDR